MHLTPSYYFRCDGNTYQKQLNPIIYKTYFDLRVILLTYIFSHYLFSQLRSVLITQYNCHRIVIAALLNPLPKSPYKTQICSRFLLQWVLKMFQTTINQPNLVLSEPPMDHDPKYHIYLILTIASWRHFCCPFFRRLLSQDCVSSSSGKKILSAHFKKF